MSKTYLVAVDGSDPAWKALDLASDLAKVSDAELLIVHVIAFEPMPEGLQAFAEAEGVPLEEEKYRFRQDREIGDRISRQAEARVRENGLLQVTARVLEGNPAKQIVASAKSADAEMIFLGNRGLGTLEGMLMGSVSHKVMNLAPCTCVAVK